MGAPTPSALMGREVVHHDDVAGRKGDATEMSVLVEEAFDLVPLLVEPPVNERRDGAAGIGPDLGMGGRIIGNGGAQPIRIIGGTGDDMTNALQTGQASACERSPR